MVDYKVRDHANWQIPMDVTGAPDTSNPEVPSAGTVRPNAVGLGLFPNAQTGVWEISTVHVVGPKVKDGKVSTKRDYTVMFTDPLGSDSVAPEWVREISREWTDRANGAGGGVPLTDRQVYDLNTRLHSNLGLQPTRKVLEDVLGAVPAPAEPVKEVSPQRSAFDSALRVLLMRENLDGAEWAIRQIRELADSEHLGAKAVLAIAEHLEGLLDKRTAELATKEH
jgi:hypothetical protein